MTDIVQKGVELLEEAADIRIGITEMYSEYRELTKMMIVFAGETVKHKDIKSAVDAIHYFGGVGYPHPNSPGRMEALIDKFVGMYRVLEFIGKGQMVVDHLAKHGMQLKIEQSQLLKNAKLGVNQMALLEKTCKELKVDIPQSVYTTADLFRFGIGLLNDMQSNICNASNRIRKEIRPELTREVHLEREEIKRGITAAKLKKKERIKSATKKRKSSTRSYRGFLDIAKRLEGVSEDS